MLRLSKLWIKYDPRVKYMLLIYTNEASRKAMELEGDAIMASVDEIMKELTESGELVGGLALAAPPQSRTVKVRDGRAVITDGPFLEAKEHLAGYMTVDVETRERALDIAARWPDARFCAMEVWPVIGEAIAERIGEA
jgi:hypothetical protein